MKEIEITIKKYEAIDGKYFDSKEECVSYEIASELSGALNNADWSLAWTTEEGAEVISTMDIDKFIANNAKQIYSVLECLILKD